MEYIKEFDEYPYFRIAEEAKPALWNRMKKHGVAVFDIDEKEMMFFDRDIDFLRHVSLTYDCWGCELDFLQTYTLGKRNEIREHCYYTTPILEQTIEDLAVLDGSVNGYSYDFCYWIIERAVEMEKRSEQVKYMRAFADCIDGDTFILSLLVEKYKLPFRVNEDGSVERTDEEVAA